MAWAPWLRRSSSKSQSALRLSNRSSEVNQQALVSRSHRNQQPILLCTSPGSALVDFVDENVSDLEWETLKTHIMASTSRLPAVSWSNSGHERSSTISVNSNSKPFPVHLPSSGLWDFPPWTRLLDPAASASARHPPRQKAENLTIG